MKRFLVLALLLMFVASLTTARAQDAAPATPLTAAQIIEKSRAAYAGLHTYRGFCVVASDMAMQSAEMNFQDVEGATTRIEFERGQYLQLSGLDSDGKKFRALVSPAENWMELEREADDKGNIKREEIVENFPDFHARQTIVASLHGISLGTASLVPDALFAEDEQSNVLFPELGDLELQDSEKMGDKEYWVVKAKTVRLGFQNLYWIDKKSFLVRRLQSVERETQPIKPATPGAVTPVASESYWITVTMFSVEEAK